MNTDTTPIPGVPRLLWLEDAAKHLGLSASNAYRLARAGKLPVKKVGGVWRMSEDDLRALCGSVRTSNG